MLAEMTPGASWLKHQTAALDTIRQAKVHGTAISLSSHRPSDWPEFDNAEIA